MISPNKFCTEVFQTAFGIDRQRLIETGYPRNDFITNANEEDIKKLKQKFDLPLDKKKLFYMHLHGVIILMLQRVIHLN